MSICFILSYVQYTVNDAIAGVKENKGKISAVFSTEWLETLDHNQMIIGHLKHYL